MSGIFHLSFDEVGRREEFPEWFTEKAARAYQDYRLVKMTGWTLEQIESAGMFTIGSFLEIENAEIAMANRRRTVSGD